MSLDLRALVPQPSSWFRSSLVYEGAGRAVLRDPPGILRGPALVRYDELGGSSIELEVEDIEPAEKLALGWPELLAGHRATVEEGKTSLGLGFDTNECTDLTVTAADGVFTASNPSFGFSLRAEAGTGLGLRLRFHVHSGAFEQTGGGSPHFWVMPLTNFLSTYHQRHPSLDTHPLRLVPTPAIPPGLEGEGQLRALLVANQHNRLIVFEYAGDRGFVEPLPDASERAERLKDGRERSLVTAIMIGRVGGDTTDQDAILGWFPAHYLSLLSLATGTPVGAPWVELRSADGTLARRLHISLGTPAYVAGRRVIEEGLHRGTGRLLTLNPTPPHLEDKELVPIIRSTLHGMRSPGHVEDDLRELFIAFEMLIEAAVGRKSKPLGALVSPEAGATVDALLTATETSLLALAKAASEARREEEAEIFEGLGSDVHQMLKPQPGFARGFLALLDRFELRDASVMEQVFAGAKVMGEKRWSGLLRSLRGGLVHEGVLRMPEPERDISFVLATLFHLHDILIRILLKILKYEGTYQPSVALGLTAAELSWVKETTPPRELRYELREGTWGLWSPR